MVIDPNGELCGELSCEDAARDAIEEMLRCDDLAVIDRMGSTAHPKT